MTIPAILALADGSVFHGTGIGAEGATTGEVVFNTAMTGYQEILTDPSYAEQIVTLTYPHIGNTGVNSEDEECPRPWAKGLVIRDLPLLASSFRSEESLSDYLKRHNTVAIADIDTRRLTRHLRAHGSQNGCIITGLDISDADAIAQAKATRSLKGMDLAKAVSTVDSYQWRSGVWTLGKGHADMTDDQLPYHVVAYDYGVKQNILRMLTTRGCRVTVVPAETPASDVLAMKPDGIFLSNGPGDPEPCDYAVKAIREILKTDTPVFGICLGHQLLALAAGAKTEKMKNGHHGANHPVQDVDTRKVMITSQNHGFAVSEASLPDNVVATHRSLFDQTLQGIRLTDSPAFSFQGHPEASPGPQDVAGLFDRFIGLMEARQVAA